MSPPAPHLSQTLHSISKPLSCKNFVKSLYHAPGPPENTWIATGTKTIEIRVGYPKIRRMAAGDGLRFVSGEDSLHTCITEIREYSSFEEMLNAEDNTAIGEPGLGREELLAACRDIYPPEKEALGVFALHVALLPG
ncbi:ASCH domain-containing protein [Streptomyces sp. NPDC052051]|uniref:ASCH domain-containing protein n=1 Tax=Streptomyces sp. NPDC052051 TaxID=3154649 RepID=UPI003421B9E8